MHDTGRRQQVRVAGEDALGLRAVALGGQGQMKMIRHQAIGEQAHGSSFAGLAKQLEKGIEVPILVEHGAAAVASIEDMVTVATLRSTSSTRHTLDYGQGPGESKMKSTTSPFILSFILWF